MRTIPYQKKFQAIRALCVMLALCFIPLFVLPAQAEDKLPGNLFGSALVEEHTFIESIAVVRDTIYIKTYRALYQFQKGDQKAQKVRELDNMYAAVFNQEEGKQPVLTHLLAYRDTLYALDFVNQQLHQLDVMGEELLFSNTVSLDLSDFMFGEGIHTGHYPPYYYFINDGRLFLRHPNYEGNPQDLFGFDIATGEKTAYKTRNLQTMTPYKDGKYLAVLFDESNRFNMDTGEMSDPILVVFDPAQDAVESLDIKMSYQAMTGTVNSIYYDAQDDSLYTFTNTDVYRYDQGFKNKRLIGYLPMYGSYGIVNAGIQPFGDMLLVGFDTNVFLRQRDEKGLEGVTVLTTALNLENAEVLQYVLLEMDDVVLRQIEGPEYEYMNGEQLAAMFLTGSMDVDLLSISAYGFDLDKLIDKGYLADLSGNESIAAFTSRLEENIKAPLTRGQAIYAVPVGINMVPLTIYEKAFKDLGLEVPTSVLGFLDLIKDWMDHLGEEHPEYALSMNMSYLKSELMGFISRAYMADAFANGKELVFDTPLFRELMEKMAHINWNGLPPEIDWTSPEGQAALDDMFEQQVLFELGMVFSPEHSIGMNNSGDRKSQALVLPLKDGMDGYTIADMRMLAVMSTSKNKEVANRFIAHYLDKMSAMYKAAFDTTWNEEIKNPWFEDGLKDLQNQLDLLAQREKTAEGAEKSNLTQAITQYRDYVEQFKEEGRLQAGLEDIQFLHELMSKVFVMNGLSNAQHMAFIKEYEAVQQLLTGAITLDHFIKQTDDKLRLVRMEYQ